MFRKTTLQNGLRVLTKKLPGTASVTVLVLVGAGCRYENDQIRGLSHFLEHMFFKGASRYKNAKEVSEAIDSVGGIFNAFTGKEYAGYFVKVASEHMKVAVDVLSDMLVNSKFKQEEVDKERGVILEEYNMYQDTPMYQIGWTFENLVFGDQPLGWDEIGTKEFIKKASHKHFVDYFEKLYTPDNAVVAICGDVDHKEATEMISDFFEMDNERKAYNFEPLKEISTDKICLVEKKTEQAHLALGFPGLSETHEDHYALMLLSAILGGGMSSRLFLAVREAKGLAYYIKMSTDDYIDGGTFAAFAGVDLKRIDDAISSIVDEYKKVVEEGVTEKELSKAKAYLKGKIVLSLEDSEEYSHYLAKYELLHGEAHDPDYYLKRLEKVTLSDINRVIKNIMVADKMKLAVIGPYNAEDKARFEKLLNF
ncbi:MAG: pitrilysin family protein [Candidatus Gracilibacteria bacterium]|jgi:predicted Zn-dependent peptidase|nr:pitrilysin family protein [Candidatus Gracilibacteria bacterium]